MNFIKSAPTPPTNTYQVFKGMTEDSNNVPAEQLPVFPTKILHDGVHQVNRWQLVLRSHLKTEKTGSSQAGKFAFSFFFTKALPSLPHAGHLDH